MPPQIGGTRAEITRAPAPAGFRIYREPDGRKLRQWLGGLAITISDDATDTQIGQFHGWELRHGKPVIRSSAAQRR